MKTFILLLLISLNSFKPVQSYAQEQNIAYQFDLQGHRGTRGLMPENTIPAFQKAMALGVNTLELDVVISKDQQVVVSHEAWINTDICLDKNGHPFHLPQERALNLYQMDYDEIQLYNCGSLRHPDFPKQQLQASPKPLLKDVVKLVQNHNRQNQAAVALNIEIKSDEQGDGIYHPKPKKFVALVMEVVQDQNMDYNIQSFDFRILRLMHERYPQIEIAALTEEKTLEEMLIELKFQPAIFSPYYPLVNREMVQKSHSKSIDVIPWTVNQLKDMKKLLALGVDGLITDYPDKAFIFKKLN